MLSTGSVVSGYRIERVLGRGGMGAVYLVANPELPRREALKIMSVELSTDPGFRARFLREAEVASRLEHPNIVPIYRRGESDAGQLWIALQFIAGTNADEESDSGRMTPERALFITGEVAKALDYAHHNNVIHRDIKPANFLLSGQPGAGERVLLADFGIARALDDAGLTGTGQMVATLAYAAPEVIAGDPVSGTADQYSLACSLFRMLTGRTPFADAGNQAAVMTAHLQRPPPRVSERAPWLPPSLDAVIATAMAKDPRRRYTSCSQFAIAVRDAMRTNRTDSVTGGFRPSSTASAAVSPAPPPLASTRRTNVIAVLLGTVAVTVTAGSAIVLLQPESNHSQQSASQPTTLTTDTMAPKPAVAGETLESVLLTDDEVAEVAGESLLPQSAIEDFMNVDTYTVSPKSCSSIFQPVGAASTYLNSRWTSVRTKANGNPGGIFVGQAAIGFPSALAAETFLARQELTLMECNNNTGTSTPTDSPANERALPFTARETILTGELVLAPSVSPINNNLQHAWTYRGRIVVEVVVLKSESAGTVIDLANRLLGKIPA